MAQLVVDSLDTDVLAALRRRAAENGRSTEAEAREILSAAVANVTPVLPLESEHDPNEGFGTQVARIFANLDEPFILPERRFQSVRAVTFNFLDDIDDDRESRDGAQRS